MANRSYVPFASSLEQTPLFCSAITGAASTVLRKSCGDTPNRAPGNCRCVNPRGLKPAAQYTVLRTMLVVLLAGTVALAQPEGDISPVSPPPVAEAPSANAPVETQLSAGEAVSAARAAIDELDSTLDPEAGTALINRINEYRDAIQASQPENPWLLYISGCILSWTGRQGDAVDLLQRFVETREGRNEWRAYRLLGDLFVTEFPRLAQGYYRNAHALKRDEPAVLFGLSRCAAKIGQYQDATRYAEQAVEAGGRADLVHLTHLARVLMAQRRWGEARTEAAEALRLAEQAARDRAGQRNPLFALDQQYQLIIEVIGGLINDTPDVVQHYLDAAAYIQARGQNVAKLNLHEALQVLEQAVNRNPDNAPPKLIEEYARILAEVGRTDEAIAQFEKLLVIAPANPIATEGLEKLRPGKAKPKDAAGESHD